MVVLLEGTPISTEELWSSVRVTIDFLVTSQFGSTASSRKNLAGSKHLPFKNNGGHSVLGDLQCCRNVLVQSCLGALWTTCPHALVFALTCTVNCGTLSRHVCAFPNHVQSIECSNMWKKSRGLNTFRMLCICCDASCCGGWVNIILVSTHIGYVPAVKTCTCL